MKSFCIIGLGRFGMKLAKVLADNGKDVLVIDSDEKNIEAIADAVDTAILGDATDEAVLRSAGVSDYQCAVVSLSENINDSVLSVIMLKELGVPYIIARAGSERHAKVLEKVGADRIVFPESDLAVRFAHMLSYDGVQQYIEFSEDASIVEFEVPHAWIGKNLVDLDVRKKYRINVITVRGANSSTRKAIFVDPMKPFKEGDMLAIMGLNDDIETLMEQIQ